jgi:GTPase SAR1 family protein
MKITEITLKSCLNFQKDLIIDLTYPLGHTKAGEPLEKICFIGQSGTGKTSLLNLIKFFSYDRNSISNDIISKELINSNVEIKYKWDHRFFSKSFINDEFHYFENGEVQGQEFTQFIRSHLRDCKPWLINFPFNVVENAQMQSRAAINKDIKPIDRFSPPQGIIDIESKKEKAKNVDIWDFSQINIFEIWDIIFEEINLYKNKFFPERNKFISNVVADVKNAEKYLVEFNEWKQENFNPIKALADDCLNEILASFNLEINSELDFENELDYELIQVRQKNNENAVPYQFLSTGTKQVMLTSIPLYFLKPSNCIILFDQLETSLYPNIQYSLPDTYQKKMAPANNQFFYATHSPVVASSFEPWEIVELKFNTNDGFVGRKEYFKDERRVDNYFINPQLMRWDSSYKLLFDLPHASNEERNDKLVELSMLEKKIMKEENVQAKNELYVKYKILAQQLDWPNSYAKA